MATAAVNRPHNVPVILGSPCPQCPGRVTPSMSRPGPFRTGSACDVSVSGTLTVVVAVGVRPVLVLHCRLPRAPLAVAPSAADDGGGLHLRVVVVAPRRLGRAECGS